MGTELFDLLGKNPDEPRFQRALRDAKDVEQWIDTLVAIRHRLGMSQAELAEEMETTQSAISKFERAGADPRISTLQRYASAVSAKIKLTVDVTACRAPAWRANYEIPSAAEPDIEETNYRADPGHVIGLAS
ncbi:helix-turn-helix domain-containing protein [Winogradskya humida]|uniref:HTH cro/C1-type domain-containing protein n=1 Tax=Winogradskya humida TaxID=113566 RepID=A0ABQ3ZME7_9ACTN|nr:helix-turn-helix domain-containing protein [Actinoplanes humidus]GIE19760.1 hypothetical protein Ahu01nite_028620 [Actinoplanes humidus]